MLYKASDIIERSLKLADIANTDFLTHKEQIQYLNDAWFTVFNWLISKGDKQFVREVELMNCQGFSDYIEYDIPDDLFMICSIKNKYSGSILPRIAESQGITANAYEVVNNKIRLYGAASGQLLLTYWTVPTYITFPDKDIVTDLDYAYSPNGYFLSRCVNTVLTKDGVIYNMLTGETYGNIVIDNTHNYILGPGYLIDVSSGNTTFRNFNDEVITQWIGGTGTFAYFYDEKGTLYHNRYSTDWLNNYWSAGPGQNTLTIEYPTEDFYKPLAKFGDYILMTNSEGHAFIVYDGNIVFDFDEYEVPMNISIENIAITDTGFFIANGEESLHIYIYDNGTIEVSEDKVANNFTIKYGTVSSDYSKFIIKSIEEDTLLNFPNDMYFSLLACDLALRYTMKQNADSSGLDNMYQNMQTTFMNSLEQDSMYNRIQNVYN